MSIQLLNSCVYQLSPTRRSFIEVSNEGIEHPMVMKYVFIKNGTFNAPGVIRKLRPNSSVEQDGPTLYTLLPQEALVMAGYFLPAITKNSGTNDFTVKFGVGDGTGEDFGGDEAAQLHIVFGERGGTNSYTQPSGSREFPDGLSSEVGSLYFIAPSPIHRSGGIVFDDGTNPQFVSISIPAAEAGARNAYKIEQSVIIHVLTQDNNLICTMGLNHNQSIQLAVEGGILRSLAGIKLVALADLSDVSPRLDPEFPKRVIHEDGSDGQFTDTIRYRIGDPVTDASVTVSSRNP